MSDPCVLLRQSYISIEKSTHEHNFVLSPLVELSADRSQVTIKNAQNKIIKTFSSDMKTSLTDGQSGDPYTMITIIVYLRAKNIRERLNMSKDYGCAHIKIMDKKKVHNFFAQAPTGGKSQALAAKPAKPSSASEKVSKKRSASSASSSSSSSSSKSKSKKSKTASSDKDSKTTSGKKTFSADEMITRLEKTTTKRLTLTKTDTNSDLALAPGREVDNMHMLVYITLDGSSVPTAAELKSDKARTADITAREITTTTGDSILVSKSKGLNIALDHFNKHRADEDTRNGNSRSTSKRLGLEKKNSTQTATGNPIIIVPNAMTSCINMYNAAGFFDSATFNSSQDSMRGGAAKAKIHKFTRVHPKTEEEIEYEIIDNPARLGTGDWNRIVAVVAQGADWQFKNWKWSTTAEIFEKSMGYYFNVQGEDVPAIMKTWNVRCGKLVGDKGRDRDKATFATFWTGLDQWMSIHKPELL